MKSGDACWAKTWAASTGIANILGTDTRLSTNVRTQIVADAAAAVSAGASTPAQDNRLLSALKSIFLRTRSTD
jgi:hypothetical protein